MSNFVSCIMQSAPAVRGLLAFEPRIGLDLSETDLSTTLVIISCLIDEGVDTTSEIIRYLTERRSKFDPAAIRFILDQYEGCDPERHLWDRSYHGEYSVLRSSEVDVYTGGPAWSGHTDYAYV